MTDIEPTQRGAAESLAKENRYLPQVATVVESFPRTRSGEGYNHEAIVEYDDGTTSAKMPVAVGFSGETRLPRKGQAVLIGYESGNPPQPFIQQGAYTKQTRAPKAKAGEWSVHTGKGHIRVGRDGTVGARNSSGHGIRAAKRVDIDGKGGGESIKLSSSGPGEI